jgi:hypothetical protein
LRHKVCRSTPGRNSFAGFALFCGYTSGTAFVIIAALKPIFPNNVGFWVDDRPAYAGFPWRLAGVFPAPLHEHVVGGYWVIPFALVCGLGLLSITHRCARRFLGWWRARRSAPPLASVPHYHLD